MSRTRTFRVTRVDTIEVTYPDSYPDEQVDELAIDAQAQLIGSGDESGELEPYVYVKYKLLSAVGDGTKVEPVVWITESEQRLLDGNR